MTVFFKLLLNLFYVSLFILSEYNGIILSVMNVKINYRKIGTRIAQRRKELDLTQAQLAEIVDLSKNHISTVETGGSYSLETLLVICDALKITPDYVLFGTIRKDRKDDFIDVLKLCDEWELSVLLDFANVLISNRNK